MEYDKLRKGVEMGMSYRKLAERFGKSETTIGYWLRKYNLKIKNHRFRSIIYKITKEELEDLKKSSTSISDMLKKLELHPNATHNRRLLKNKLMEFGLGHISFKPHTRGFSNLRLTKEEVLNRLSITQPFRSAWKKHLITYKLKDHTKCSICGHPNIWNGRELILQIDHIDGDNTNNVLDNLRFVCPNCHTQTPTFCGKHKKIPKMCIGEGCERKVYGRGKKCNECVANAKKRLRKVERPSPKILLQKLKESNFVKVAKLYDVSDTTIRKWCVSYDIPTKKKEYINFSFDN